MSKLDTIKEYVLLILTASLRGESREEAQDRLYRHLEEVIPQWQPIESAPRETVTGFLVFEADTRNIYLISERSGEEFWVSEHYTIEPTHWMPLPLLPNQEEVSS